MHIIEIFLFHPFPDAALMHICQYVGCALLAAHLPKALKPAQVSGILDGAVSLVASAVRESLTAW